MTDDEWAAIERPLRLAILEHCGMSLSVPPLVWNELDGEWRASTIDHTDGVQFDAAITRDGPSFWVRVIAHKHGNPKGSVARTCATLQSAKAWVRRAIMESD